MIVVIEIEMIEAVDVMMIVEEERDVIAVEAERDKEVLTTGVVHTTVMISLTMTIIESMLLLVQVNILP